ncbi:MAG: polymerase [Variovorax sp.]|nr:MAG: polymerase [Variovorax sp.]
MQGASGTRAVACGAAIAIPFLFPFVSGPSASAWQLLGTLVCIAVLALVTAWIPGPRVQYRVLAWLAVPLIAIIAMRSDAVLAWLPASASLCAVALAVVVGSRASAHPAMFRAFSYGLLIAALISAVLGLLQYYGHAEPLVPWTTSPGLGQAYGNLRQRNQFATLLSMATVALLWLYATTGVSRRRRLLLLAALPLLLVGQAAATSRTGLLQLLCIVGVAAWMARRDTRLPPWWLLCLCVPFYFVAGWVLPQLAGGGVDEMVVRLREGAPIGHSRLVLWRNVLALIAQHPWVGWGWGELSFAHYSTLYDGPRFVEILDNAHNLPLHLAVELGIPVAVLVCGGFAWLVWSARPWQERDPARLMVWGVLAMIVLHSLLEYPLWYGPFQLVFGVCLGLLWPAPARAETSKRNRPLASALSAIAALILIAVVGYAGWDYTRVSQIYLARDARLPAWRDDTLEKIRPSWLFANQVRFAKLALTPVTRANAEAVHAIAQRTLHFSPEPAVVIKLIESATLLGRDDEAFAQAKRFRLAYPADYARWIAGQPMLGPGEQ